MSLPRFRGHRVNDGSTFQEEEVDGQEETAACADGGMTRILCRAFFAVMTLASTPLMSAQGQVTDVPTGPGVGLEVGLINFGGNSGSVIGAGPAYTALVGYTTRARWQFNGGIQYSNHGLENINQRYQVSTMFLESRYRLFQITPRIRPFIGARVGRRWESVTPSGATFKAVGHLFGGSGGFLYQLDPQVGLETGARFMATAFGDFVFGGEQAWNNCLEAHRPNQTALPLSVVDCSPPRRSRVQLTAGGVNESGNRATFLHPGSARMVGAFTFWVRVVIASHGPRHPT